jgi:hypothetical protein
MSIIKRAVIVGALAVGLTAVYNDLSQEKAGESNEPVWGPTVQPREPEVSRPVVPETVRPEDGLSGRNLSAMNRCLGLVDQLRSPVLQQVVYQMNDAYVRSGTELIPYHVNVVCENMVSRLSMHALDLKPGQCLMREYSFAAVDDKKKISVELCRDENTSPRDTRVHLGQTGVRLVP